MAAMADKESRPGDEGMPKVTGPIRPSGRVSPSWHTYAVLVIAAVCSIGALVFAFRSGMRTFALYAPLGDAAAQLKFRAAMGHLCLEEMLNGDRNEDIDHVLERFAAADSYARAMIEGGGGGNTLLPLDDPTMRQEIAEARRNLAELKAAAIRRYNARVTAGSGTEMDRQYDAVFTAFVRQTEQVEAELRRLVTRDKETFRWAASGMVGLSVLLFAGVLVLVGRQVAGRDAMVTAVRESEERYRSLFEDSPISLWEEDFSDVTREIARLRGSGVEDFREYLGSRPEEVDRLARMVRVVDVNRSTLDLYGAESKEAFFEGLPKVFGEESYDVFREELIAIADGERTFESEAVNLTFSGERKDIVLRCSVAPGHEETWSKVFVSVVDVTARRQAEEEIRRLARFPSENPNPVMRVAADGTIVYGNTAAAPLLTAWGCAVGQVLPDRWREVALKVLHSESAAEVEADAVERTFSLTFAPVTESDYVNVYGLDITERNHAERSLRESEERYRLLMASAGDAILVADAETGVLLDANRRAEELIGRSREDIRGMHQSELHPAEEKAHYEELFRRRARADSSGLIEAHVVNQRGERIPVSISAGVVEVGGRRVIQGIFRDMSEQRRAERETARLRDLLRNIIDCMPSVLVGVDAEGRVTQWNREAERMTGLPEEKARGSALGDVFPALGPEMGRVRRAMASGETQRHGRALRETDEGTRFDDVTIYPLVGGGVEGAVIRVDDVTERVRMEELMIQSEKMMSVGGLAAGMAHEINNPLAAMLLNMELMQHRFADGVPKNLAAAAASGTTLAAIRRYVDERGILKSIDSMLESGRRAAQIVDNMLSFSRKSESTLEPRDLRVVLDKTAELASSDYDLKKKYDFRRIEVVREYDTMVPDVPCDESKMQQVFLNLLQNGAQAMAEANTESPRFWLRVKADDGWVRAEVEDNGPGMDEATCRRVFEPFFTTKEVGAGTGLGLSVSYFIVTENHGGTLEVESTPGKGTKFIIRLPIEEGESS